jgi:hypothetical protein
MIKTNLSVANLLVKGIPSCAVYRLSWISTDAAFELASSQAALIDLSVVLGCPPIARRLSVCHLGPLRSREANSAVLPRIRKEAKPVEAKSEQHTLDVS